MKMTVDSFCGDIHFAALDFTFRLLNEIASKIQERVLFYEEQIVRYARARLHHFLQTFSMPPAMKNVYKNEVWSTILFKLKQVVKEKGLFQCV